MSESRKKILEMLSKGKISVDEAADLLSKIGSESTPEESDTSMKVSGKKPRYLRVTVDSADGDKVNVRVPLSLVKTGIKLGALMPKQASEAINQQGFDLAELANLNGDELIEALADLEVNVDSADGDIVRVFCE